jgi:hypothetical protein
MAAASRGETISRFETRGGTAIDAEVTAAARARHAERYQIAQAANISTIAFITPKPFGRWPLGCRGHHVPRPFWPLRVPSRACGVGAEPSGRLPLHGTFMSLCQYYGRGTESAKRFPRNCPVVQTRSPRRGLGSPEPRFRSAGGWPAAPGSRCIRFDPSERQETLPRIINWRVSILTNRASSGKFFQLAPRLGFGRNGGG